MRTITLNADGDLVAINPDGTHSNVDYSKIKDNQFVDDVGNAYCRYGVLTDYSNEIFINYFIRKEEWLALISDGDKLVKSDNNSIIHSLWNEVVESSEQYRERSSKFLLFLSWLKLSLACIACLGIVILRKLKTIGCNNDQLEKISIVRSKAAYSKLASVAESFSITLVSEDIVYQNNKLKSIFSFLSFGQCLLALVRAIGPTFKDFGRIVKELETVFGPKVAAKLIYHYSSRIALKCTFEQLLTALIKNKFFSEIVTGNKEDRFAMTEKRLCASHGIHLTCIPHGLEYSYQFPSGIAGDVFYCTSDKAKSVLSKLYPTTRFIYDESLQRLMYRISGKSIGKVGKERGIVFFTESRDIDVNRKIIDDLNFMGLKFSVRLHPKDSKNNYLDKLVFFEDNYNAAICNSICIGRKSTVLIEAICNDSISIAYLINAKDRYYVSEIFPSLSSNNIRKCVDKDSLAQVISC